MPSRHHSQNQTSSLAALRWGFVLLSAVVLHCVCGFVKCTDAMTAAISRVRPCCRSGSCMESRSWRTTRSTAKSSRLRSMPGGERVPVLRHLHLALGTQQDEVQCLIIMTRECECGKRTRCDDTAGCSCSQRGTTPRAPTALCRCFWRRRILMRRRLAGCCMPNSRSCSRIG